MHRLTKVKQDIVGHVDHVIDRTDTFVHEEVLQPLWTWCDGYIVQDTSCIVRSLVCVNADRKSIGCSLVCFSQRKVFEIDCLVIDGCYFVRYPTHRKSICTVWSDGKFNNFIIQVEVREDFFSWNSIFWQDLDAICEFFWYHNLDACSHIWCSTDDLTRFFFTHINLANMKVCLWHIFTRQDFSDDNF